MRPHNVITRGGQNLSEYMRRDGAISQCMMVHTPGVLASDDVTECSGAEDNNDVAQLASHCHYTHSDKLSVNNVGPNGA